MKLIINLKKLALKGLENLPQIIILHSGITLCVKTLGYILEHHLLLLTFCHWD